MEWYSGGGSKCWVQGIQRRECYELCEPIGPLQTVLEVRLVNGP
jgi:hypothetical protein